jgi:hypothetical protein
MDNLILTAGKFEQIMATLKSESGSREKRESARVGLRMQARIIVHSQKEPVQGKLVWLRDVSTEGIGFMHVTPVAVGTLMVVCLPRGTAGSLKLLYRIVRCNSVDKDQYILGAKLDRVLEDSVPPAAAAPTAAAPAPTEAAASVPPAAAA